MISMNILFKFLLLIYVGILSYKAKMFFFYKIKMNKE